MNKLSEDKSKRLAIENCTSQQSVTSLESNTESSIYDLPEHVKAKYKDTRMYDCLENAELDYAVMLAKTECIRCTQDTPGETICCKENCRMFEAKVVAKEKGFASYSACYNCPRYNNSCLGIEHGDCRVEDNSIPLVALDGVIDDDMYQLLDELDMDKIGKGLFKTLKSTIEYFDNKSYSRTDLIFCTYLLNAVSELLLSHSSLPQVEMAQITSLPGSAYKAKFQDGTVVYATKDYILINGNLPKHMVLRALELQIEDYKIPSLIEWS